MDNELKCVWCGKTEKDGEKAKYRQLFYGSQPFHKNCDSEAWRDMLNSPG